MSAFFSRFFQSPRRVNHLIGLSLAGLYLSALLLSASNLGFARDEGFYFSAARSYQKWFDVLFENPSQAFSKETIDQYWKINHEHPALMKTLFGFSERFFCKKLKVMSPSTANRFPGMVTAALTVYLLFLFGAEVFDRRAGIAATLFFGLMPRVFYHAHLACFDMPMTFMWLAVFYLYRRSLSSWKYGFAAGAVFGLSLCTKLNAFFLPFLIVLHYLLLVIYQKRSRQKRNRQKCSREKLPCPSGIIFGIILAPIIFFIHWPWIWHDTLPRLIEYMGFHSGHPHYNTAWFGENIVQAPTPILLPLVMTLFTVPSTIILLFLFGAALRLRHHLPAFIECRLLPAAVPVGTHSQNGFDFLWALAFAFPIALISLPSVPDFGGTKHWMPAFPFMALIAGAAVTRLIDVVAQLVPKLKAEVVAAGVVILVTLPPFQQTVTSHPFGLASYVPLIGGAPGAATLGMTRQFWGYTTRGVIPWLNEHYPNGARVEIHDTAVSSWLMYQEDGILNRNIKPAQLADSNVALLHHELHMVLAEAWIWNRYNILAPTHMLTYQGVPILSIYTKPEKKE